MDNRWTMKWFQRGLWLQLKKAYSTPIVTTNTPAVFLASISFLHPDLIWLKQFNRIHKDKVTHLHTRSRITSLWATQKANTEKECFLHRGMFHYTAESPTSQREFEK